MIAERNLTWAPLDPPIREHYAFVTRTGGTISPATGQFMRLAHSILQRLKLDTPFELPNSEPRS